jgi:hypothetical protein
MAKSKRHTLGNDMNALNLDDTMALTDQEQEQLQMNIGSNKKSVKRKKAM